MPVEIRRISFSEGEVIDAIGHFAKATRHPMPPGKITACEINSKVGLAVTVTVNHMADGSSHAVRFDSASVAAALIRYCIEKKIPIPKAAEKSVEALSNGLALILQLGKGATT
jgi:hypothetical protein